MKLNFESIAIIYLAASFVQPVSAQSAGADTYKAKCQMCHGADGLGATPAGRVAKIVPFKDPLIVNAPDADLIAVVKKGKNKMPPFAGKLSDDQIESVVAYIRTLEK
ncbi:MAG: cytochrome c [Terracidiphilus sp.]|jgi:mono/diheme cytochrome c family protein